MKDIRRSATRFLPYLLAAMIGTVVAAPAPERAVDLFQQTAVWNIHLKFTPEQWTQIEPKQPAGPGPRFGPGGPGRFNPGEMLVSSFLSGDSDSNGKISNAEFQEIGDQWFSRWNNGTSGTLTTEQIRQGLAALLPRGPGGRPGPEGRGPGFLGPEGGRNGLSAAAGTEFNYVHADLDFQGRDLRDVAVRYKGNNTFMMARNSIKRSFKIDLNKYVKGQKLAGQTTLNLHNNITDASWMNEVLSYQLFRDAGVQAPRTSYARVYVTVPGTYEHEYFGLYSIVENIDDRFAQDRFGSDEGAIYKPVTRDLFGYIGDDWGKYNQTYDPKTKLTGAQKSRVIDFARFVSNASDADFADGLADYLDLDQFARFMAVTVWLSNTDSILGMGQNFYVYLEAGTNRFRFLPWDLDHSFGQFAMGGGQSETLNIHRPWQGRNRFLERVFDVPAFRKLYLAKMAAFNGSIFDGKRIAAQVDKVGAAIRPAIAEESSSLLSRFDAALAGKQVAPDDRRGPPGPGRGPMGRGNPIKAFVAARSQSVSGQLDGKAETMREPRPAPFGGPGGFGLERLFFPTFDTDKDGALSQKEFTEGFASWFAAWNTDQDGDLTKEEIRTGLNAALPPPPMPPGRPF